MSMLIQAPYNVPQTSVILPNPQLGDTDGHDLILSIKRSLTGGKITHIKRNQQRILNFQLILTRAKTEELKEFVKAYYGEEMRLFDWRDRVWKGIWESNDFIVTPIRYQEDCIVDVSFRGQII